MDNLSVYKRVPIRAALEAAGCRMVFLPAYSPDCDPIEQAFHKIKACLRRVGARTKERLKAATGEALDLITPSDACACCVGHPRSREAKSFRSSGKTIVVVETTYDEHGEGGR
jgi:hypothetical protein